MREKSLKYAEITEGQKLAADSGFTCLDDGHLCTVEHDPERALFVACAEGRHFLDGQEGENGELIGFSPVDPS